MGRGGRGVFNPPYSTYVDNKSERLAGPWEWGTISYVRKETEQPVVRATKAVTERGLLAAVVEEPAAFVLYHRGLQRLDSLLPRPARPVPDVELYYGPPGCGKSRACRVDVMGEPLRYRLDFAVHSPGGGFWFDSYLGQATYLIEDFAGAASAWRLDAALAVFDRYDIDLPIKGGFTPFYPRTIRVTTNVHPAKWWDWTERTEEYPALKRRFTAVYYCGRSRRQRDVARRPGDYMASEQDLEEADRWDRFWAGPRTTGALAPPRVGVQVDHQDNFNFMFQ